MEYSRLFLASRLVMVLRCLCWDPMAIADLEAFVPSSSIAVDAVRSSQFSSFRHGLERRLSAEPAIGRSRSGSSPAPLPELNPSQTGPTGCTEAGGKERPSSFERFSRWRRHIKTRRSESSAPRGGQKRKKEKNERSPPSHSISNPTSSPANFVPLLDHFYFLTLCSFLDLEKRCARFVPARVIN